MIKHLVLPGGGPTGFIDYGIIEHLEKNNFFNIKNIESIHSTSVGSLIACTLCFKLDWSYYRDFLICGHHDKTFYIDPNNIMNILSAKSLVAEDCFKNHLNPFFLALDLDIETTTLKDFYEFNNITFNIYATKVNNISTICFNHITHPDLLLIDAMKASCAIPVIFKPLIYKNELYVDGGVLTNYPLRECLECEGVEPSEVLGINHIYKETNEIKNDELNNYNIFDLVLHILWAIIEKLVVFYLNNKENKDIIDEKLKIVKEVSVKMDSTSTTPSDLFNSLNSKEIRQELIEKGEKIASEYILSQSGV